MQTIFDDQETNLEIINGCPWAGSMCDNSKQ
jgi:hypothetical protein